MNRSIILISGVFLLLGTASAQVTCTRTGDQMYCNGSLQQPRPAAPRVYSDPYGSRQSGYEAGVQAGRARNLASATQMYLNGEISPGDRERFLAYISKNGGDVIWFRNDMVIKDQQQSIANSSRTSGLTTTSSMQAGAANPQAASPSVAERLRELDTLLKSGAISQSEYDAKRKEILRSL